MNNNQLLGNLINLIISFEFTLIFIGFLLISYILLALFTWSFIKPLKYMATPFIIIGTIFTLIRIIAPVIISGILKNQLNIPSSLISPLLSPILKSGIICIISGIVMLILYKIITKVLNKKSKDDSPIDNNEATKIKAEDTIPPVENETK